MFYSRDIGTAGYQNIKNIIISQNKSYCHVWNEKQLQCRMRITQESYICVMSVKAFMPVLVCIKDRQTHPHAWNTCFLVISFGDFVLLIFTVLYLISGNSTFNLPFMFPTETITNHHKVYINWKLKCLHTVLGCVYAIVRSVKRML